MEPEVRRLLLQFERALDNSHRASRNKAFRRSAIALRALKRAARLTVTPINLVLRWAPICGLAIIILILGIVAMGGLQEYRQASMAPELARLQTLIAAQESQIREQDAKLEILRHLSLKTSPEGRLMGEVDSSQPPTTEYLEPGRATFWTELKTH